MELNVYRNQYQEENYLEWMGIIDNASSIIWTRKYAEPGEFEIHIPNTQENREMMAEAEKSFTDILIGSHAFRDVGIIEYMKIEEGMDTSEIMMKGRFASVLLDRHIIKGTYYANNIACEQTVKDLLGYSPFIRLKIIQIGSISATGMKTTFQATYKNILSHLEKVAGYTTCGFEVIPDYDARNFLFNFFKGKDRTGADPNTPKAEFSDELENVNHATYELDKSNERNYEYVGGQGEGSARIIVQAGNVTDELLRKERFYNASGESKSNDDTEEQYRVRLLQRGEEDLNGYKITESFECDTGADGNVSYGEDYDLGDVVLVMKKSWGISKKMRITEITETYESGGRVITPTFGDPLPEAISWEDD